MADTNLTAGSIAFTGFNADGADSLSFVVLQDISAGTVINFTDNAWDGTAFSNSESIWSWTAGGNIAAGTVVTLDDLNNTATSNLGAIAYAGSATRDIESFNEGVFAYVGDSSSPTFLSAIANNGFTTGSGLLTNTGLTEGSTAVAIGTAFNAVDIGAYNGPHGGVPNYSDFLAAINNPANWITQFTSGDGNTDGHAPDTPFSTTPFENDPSIQSVGFASDSVTVSHNEGADGTTTTYTFTVVRGNGSTGELHFSGTMTPGSDVDANDFGGVLQKTFSGTIADGATTGTVTITVSGDHVWEADESFKLALTSVTNVANQVAVDTQHATATGTIVNDDPRQTIGFSDDTVSVSHNEGADGSTTTYTFTVVRSGTAGNLTFNGFVFPGASTDAGDFGGTLPSSFTGVIPDGQASVTLSFTVTGDGNVEGNNAFSVDLFGGTNDNGVSVVLDGNSIAAGTIVNDDFTVHNGETIFDALTLSGTDHLMIENGGGVNAAITLSGANADAVIDNHGTLQAFPAVAMLGTDADGTLTINNYADGQLLGSVVSTVSGPHTGVATVIINNDGKINGGTATALNIGGIATVINNSSTGVITATVSIKTSTNVIFTGVDTTINNAGQITGGRDAIFAGDGDIVHNEAGGLIQGGTRHAVTGSNALTVINDAGGTMIGTNGSAVNIDNGATEAEKVFVTNHGDMEGRSAKTADSDGDAIDVDGLVHVDNYGMVQGLGAQGYHDGEANVSEGIAVGGGEINNYKGGEIYGFGRAIQVDNSGNAASLGAVTIYNEGLIQGDGHGPDGVLAPDAAAMQARIDNREAIDILGNFADTITNKGTILGGVFTDGGNDTLTNSGTMTALKDIAIDMGAGDDKVILQAGSNVTGNILLGAGDDSFTAAGVASLVNVDGGDGNDTIIGGNGNDQLQGGSGNDNLQGAAGNDEIHGGDGDDKINGGNGADVLYGDAGVDTIYGSDGNDEIHGGDGNDQLQGEGGNDTIYGDAGSDFVVGGDGDDTIHGGDGNDQLFGQNGDDTIEGGAGADKLSGDGGNDTLIAGAGDTVLGGTGDDTIFMSIQDGNPASIDGGDGSDTVHLTGEGVGAFDKTANVETLDVDAGIWTVKGTENYDAITIAAGAKVANTISVTESMTVTVGGQLTPTSGRAIDAKNGLADGSSLVVDVLAGGQIITGDDAIRINKDFDNGTVTVDNAGLIQATGGQAIDLTEVTSDTTKITIINEATGLIAAVDADAVRGGGNTTIDNYGQILSTATGDDVNDGIDFQDEGDGTVHNHTGGTIVGAHHGITGAQGITVINDAGGQIIGQSGSAVNIDNDSAVADMVTITNRGTMLGMANASQDDSDGDAVDVDGLLKLDNYGQIRGTGAYGYHDGTTAAEANVSEGVAAGGGTINNYAGATIYGYGRAIQIDDSANGAALAATTIYNEGTIQGDGHGPANVDPADAATVSANLAGREAIDILGSFDDTITNKGTIIGGVFTDGGDDIFNAYVGSTVSKTIDLGAGNDTVNLFATDGSSAKGTLGAVVNAENLNVQSGTWKLTDGAVNFTNITVGDGASVTTTIQIGDGDHLVVEAGGTVTMSDAGSSGASAVQWNGGTTTIDNYGTITATATNGNAVRGAVSGGGDLTFINHEGASVDALLYVGGPAGSSMHLTNAGKMTQISAVSDLMDVTIDNLATGIITTDKANRDLVKLGGSVHFTNAGQIISKADSADGRDAGGDAVEYGSDGTGVFITNKSGGYIEGSRHAVTGEGGATIVNEADATLVGRNGSGINVDNDGAIENTVYVTNKGDILGKSQGNADSDGDAIDVDGLVQIDNWGNIKGLGASGYHGTSIAINANVSEGIAVGGGSITNHEGGMIYGYGRAIEVDDSSNGPASAATTIVNEGTIQGDGHGPSGIVTPADAAVMQAKIDGREAIDILGNFADTITNTATGKIIGGIFTDGGADTLSNAGSITALAGSAVNMGDGDDTVSNTGKIIGAALLGAGDDVFNASVGSTSGTIDGGDGVDTVNLQGTGNGSFGTTTNVENLNVKSGTWTVAGSQNYKAIDVASGATVNAALILGAHEALTIEQGGTVQASGGVIVVNGGTQDTLVTNDGTINVLSAAGNKIDAITVNSGTMTVHNTEHGVIEGARHAITGSGAITVINDAGGLIVGHNGSAVNMDNGSSEADAAHITNYGTMLGDSAGISDSDGDAVDVDGIVYLDNYGTVRGEGANGTHKGEANVSEGVAAGGGTIHNYAGATIYGYGRAIQIDNSSNGPAAAATTIINDGTIQGDGHPPVNYETGSANGINIDGREAIDILGNFADTITNTATGKIIGGIFTDGGNDTLNNAGLIDGKVDMGAGDDQVNLTGNSHITGNILLGEGNDVLTDVVGSTSAIIVDAGAGNDTITGGGGNDTLVGGMGSDTFNYVSGDGNDTIVEGTGNAGDSDTLNLKDFNASDVTLARDGDNLDITLKDGSKIVVSGQFAGGGVENISFHDGSTIDRGDIVDATNHAPTVAQSISVTTDEEKPVSGAISATDIDGDTLTYTVKDDGAEHHGALTVNPDGTWSYTPDHDYNGHDSFVVTVSDGHTSVNTTIDVTINAVNDAPVLQNVSNVTGTEDTPINLSHAEHWVAFDVDAASAREGTVSLTLWLDNPSQGLLSASNNGLSGHFDIVTNSDGSLTITATAGNGDPRDAIDLLNSILRGDNTSGITFTSAENANGDVTVHYALNDHGSTGTAGNSESSGEFHVNVTPVNDAPVTVADMAHVGEHDTASFDLVGNDTDVDNGTPHLTDFKVTGVDGIDLNPEDVTSAFKIGPDGQLHFDGGDLFGSLNDGDHATVTISYTATDAGGAHADGVFTLTVDGVTDLNPINGTSGSDILFDTSKDDHISGGDGNDVIFTSSGSDLVDAGKGDDTVSAITGNATINGGDGNDTILGGSGNTVLNGDNGNDTIISGTGTAVLNGGAGNDTLIANAGQDIVIGGQGNDQLYGGAGSDTFVFKAGDGQDTVFGFQAAGASHDVVEVDSHAFADFTALMTAVHDTATGAQLQYADGSMITLSGVTKAHLTVDDFHFA